MSEGRAQTAVDLSPPATFDQSAATHAVCSRSGKRGPLPPVDLDLCCVAAFSEAAARLAPQQTPSQVGSDAGRSCRSLW